MNSELSINDMINILLKDPHVKDIHHPEPKIFPKIDYSIWETEVRETRKIYVEYITEYINSYFIEDDFGSDHDKRRSWRIKTESEYYWFWEFYEKNALKYGRIFDLNQIILPSFILGYVGTENKQLEKIVWELKGFTKMSAKEYDLKSTAEKIMYFIDVRQKTYGLIQFLGNQCPIKSTD